MEKEQAYQQIEALQHILKASHHFLQESKFHIEAGILLISYTLLSLIKLFIINSKIATSNSVELVYLALLITALVLFLKRNIKTTLELNKNLHPILKKVRQYFTVHYIGFALISVIFIIYGRKEFLLPIFFIFYGININLIGRFSHKPIQYSSWIYIILGALIGILLAKEIIANSEFLKYITFGIFGFCHLITGILVKKNELLANQ